MTRHDSVCINFTSTRHYMTYSNYAMIYAMILPLFLFFMLLNPNNLVRHLHPHSFAASMHPRRPSTTRGASSRPTRSPSAEARGSPAASAAALSKPCMRHSRPLCRPLPPEHRPPLQQTLWTHWAPALLQGMCMFVSMYSSRLCGVWWCVERVDVGHADVMRRVLEVLLGVATTCTESRCVCQCCGICCCGICCCGIRRLH